MWSNGILLLSERSPWPLVQKLRQLIFQMSNMYTRKRIPGEADTCASKSVLGATCRIQGFALHLLLQHAFSVSELIKLRHVMFTKYEQNLFPSPHPFGT